MPPSVPNHYEVLGLPTTATPEQIKRRYRELARRCHPDVAKTSDAAERFKEINEANTVLSDPSKRANYDALLKLEELKSKRATEESRRADTETKRQGDTAPSPRAAAKPAAAQAKPQKAASTQPSAARKQQEEAAQILSEAQKAMSRRRFREAEVLARRANRIRRTSLGYEILGDVFRARGSNDEAVAMYSYALQLDRSNHDVQRKFDRLVGQQSGPTMAGTAARASRRGGPVRASGNAPFRGSSLAAAALGMLALVALLIATSRIGSPATGPWLLDFDGLYVFALAGSGLLVGFVVSVLGVVPSARAELFASAPRPGRRAAFPVGPLVIAFSLLNFYAALLVFLVTGFLTDRLPRSLVLAFAASFATTLVFAIVNASAAGWTLLSGAGVVLLGYLGGWSAAGALGMDGRR